MHVKYQIFVSSTFEDLKEERRKVIEAILNLGHIPVGMELFQAGDESQWSYIQRRITTCDYYLVLIAERYGSEQDGKSYTQMEYEFARDNGIPTAALLLDNAARQTWPRDRVEFEKQAKVDAFRDICQQKMCKYWANADELAAKAILAITELTRDKPRTGWVRADRVPSDEVLKEMMRLSEENRDLRSRMAEMTQAENIQIPLDVLHRIAQLQMDFLSGYGEGYDVEDEAPSLLDVFLNTHKALAVGAELWQVWEVWRQHFKIIGDDNETAEHILGEFSANNLIDFDYKPTPGGRHVKQYRLTPYGKDFAMYAYNYLTRGGD